MLRPAWPATHPPLGLVSLAPPPLAAGAGSGPASQAQPHTLGLGHGRAGRWRRPGLGLACAGGLGRGPTSVAGRSRGPTSVAGRTGRTGGLAVAACPL
eukprot:2431422-Alexandrium_andersonii.AAC.1